VPIDVSDSFALEEMPSAPLDAARVEPMPASVTLAPSGPAPPEKLADPPPLRFRDRVVTPGLFVSLALHLSPLLLLVGWASAPADVPPPPIAVQVVFEPPPPAPAAEKIRPHGPLASEDMGSPAPQQPTPPSPETAPELKTALTWSEPPAEPLPQPDASLTDPLPPPEPPRRAVAKPAPTAHRTEPTPYNWSHKWRVLGPPATRDEYLAHLANLTRRHLDLLSLSLLAGRRGTTALSILVLGDGTIARISVAQSSGYPDIDRQVERMVAAVGRFPPLPQWLQESRLDLLFRIQFPEALER
jgi:periplasmic protein TonB